MNQIDKLEERLKQIGFSVEKHENILQITGLCETDAENSHASKLDLGEIDIARVSHVLQVVIESDDPFATGGKFLFQNCSLKVYFEGWDLQDVAKIIKLNIAKILDEHGVFEGMDFSFPEDHKEVLVP